MMVRLWNVPTGNIVDWQKTADVITSLQFSPDARKLLVGVYKGQCFVFSFNSHKYCSAFYSRLTYLSVINCRNRSGKYSDGRKVMGIYFINNVEVLITTADSRLRIINLNVHSSSIIGLRTAIQVQRTHKHSNTNGCYDE